ncbi:MAG TPA: ribonuclease III [bacterium]|nr:ribonuclease III [bacterium]HOL34622.1 ribonuclease III [bacterium]HPP08168.1 ribonuclease III [bacterium]
MQNLKEIEHKIGYTFKNPELLEIALTHSSYAHQTGRESYERFEFLGDAIMNFFVTIEIFRKNPEKNEQFLTELKSAYVNKNFLQKLGRELGLERCIKQIGVFKPRLDQVVEALIGAIYIDGGYYNAKKFVKKFILGKTVRPLRDYKNLLKSAVSEKFNKEVRYKLEMESGPPHDKTFRIEVSIPGEKLSARATGKSKKEAELKAAKLLLNKIQKAK